MVRYILFFLFFSSLHITAQKIVEKSYPTGRLPWTQGVLPSNSSSVDYRVIYAEESSLTSARDEALAILVTDLGKDKGVIVSDKTIQDVRETISSDSPDFFKRSVSRSLQVKFEDYELSFAKVDEYFERVITNGVSKYRIWQLFAIDGYPDYQSLEYTSKYPTSTILKSAVVPGWAQFEKRQSGKGLLFLAATGASIGLYLKANNDYNYYVNRREEAVGLDLKKEYQKKADSSLSLRNVSLAAAAGIWVFNLIDAASPNGAPRYASSNGIKFNFTTTDNERLALNLKYKF